MQLASLRFLHAISSFPALGVALVLLLGLFPGSPSASNLILEPFQSEYGVDYSGFQASRKVSLEKVGEEYILRSTTRLKGIARLSGYGPVYEVSRFVMYNGMIRPTLYSIGEDKKNPKRDIRIKFDWVSGISKGFAKGEARSFPLSPGMQDPLSFELMGRLLLAEGKRDFVLQVHEGHRVRDYRFIEEEEETLNIASRALSSTRFFIDRNSSRELYYWFADDAGYLPLQIRQLHEQKTKGTVVLTRSTLLD
ncbi:MAG TPA: hypothetical protein DHW07_06900 [Gammaproteobacteria bacterium]|nr:hypothetical protein [Gammaproteobacteria bacterium]|tara:strand:- start:5 stop:757 length:753 start_codon:yes stop_codon:yes gene_type:complete